MKKLTAGLDIKENPRLSLIEQLISFITMHQGSSETNDEYFFDNSKGETHYMQLKTYG